MEFYLVDELECDLTVFHSYRTLMTLCGKEGGAAVPEAEAGEADADDVDGPRYWGTGEGKLELQEGALQMAWCVRFRYLLLCMESSNPPRKVHYQRHISFRTLPVVSPASHRHRGHLPDPGIPCPDSDVYPTIHFLVPVALRFLPPQPFRLPNPPLLSLCVAQSKEATAPTRRRRLHGWAERQHEPSRHYRTGNHLLICSMGSIQ